MLLPGRLWLCCALSLAPWAGSPLGVSTQVMRHTDADPVVTSQALRKLHEMLQIGEPEQNAPPHRKPPQFMMDLYNAVADRNGVTKERKFLEGNVVRSFEDRAAVRSPRNVHFFNLSSFGKNEKMIKAEFRMFRSRHKFFLSRKSHRGHLYKISIYELLDNKVNPWRGSLVTSRFLSLYTQGWHVFDVTNTVSKWIQNSDENKGFLVVITLPSENFLDYDTPAVDLKLEEKNSYLVIFSEEGRRTSKTDQLPFHGQRRRSAAEAAGEVNSVVSRGRTKSRNTRAAPWYSRGRSVTCRQHPLYVDFDKIGWSGWIISPRGYDAYYCSGTCPFPLGEGFGATNHATVQSIVNALKLTTGVETPCCVPDKLHSISLLYFDDDENVVLKQYENMVAVSCACH
ncbi:bone morphogenetic protein 2-B-like [Scleropages formosus]|uniref:Bone morphogenetic protein 2-B-like n=1 Tax=Scleropages formosus TaxID=113540 RepID=A0A0P7U5S9_SCLFO|nr:bone morphogenetic protein 2-B-like [Scleropages formosus]